MAANTLSILSPSVNNLTARIFVRAAGLEFEEIDVWGKKGTPEFLAKDPADLTPLLQEDGLPRGSLFPQYPGEVGSSGADAGLKAQAQNDAMAAIAQFIGDSEPSIADIRLAATLEFMHAIDHEFAARGYVASMKSPVA